MHLLMMMLIVQSIIIIIIIIIIINKSIDNKWYYICIMNGSLSLTTSSSRSILDQSHVIHLIKEQAKKTKITRTTHSNTLIDDKENL